MRVEMFNYFWLDLKSWEVRKQYVSTLVDSPANNETKLCLRCKPVICRHCRQRISVKNMPQNC